MTGRAILGLALIAGLRLAGSALAEVGLVAHYSFEEGPGRGVKDWSGNGNDGRIAGDVAHVELADGNGYALRFSAGSGYVDCGSGPGLDLRDALTIELWFRPETAPAAGTEAALAGKGLGSYALTYVPGSCWWYVCGGVNGGEPVRLDVSAGDVRPASFWRHIAATFDGTESRVYVDGQMAATRAFAGKRNVNEGGAFRLRDPLLYGGDRELPFACLMDEVRVYDRALPAAELLRHYRADRDWRQGRQVAAGALALTHRLYPTLSKLRVELDIAGLQPVPEGTTLAVDLQDPTADHVVEGRQTRQVPPSDRWVVVFDTSQTHAGDYVVRASATDGAGNCIGPVSSVGVTVPRTGPTRTEQDERTTVLNNLVSELLNVPALDRTERRQYRFTNPRKGWVFIASDATVAEGGEVWLLLDLARREDAVITHRPGHPRRLEAMRHLSAGEHTLDVCAEGGQPNSVVVRAVPETLYAEIGYEPSTFLPGLGSYTWETLEKKGLLPNLNVVLERHPEGSYAQCWRRQGKRVLTYGTTHALRSNTADGASAYWSGLEGFQRPDRDGIMFDELSGDADLSWYPALSGGVRRLFEDPLYREKVLYPYCTGMYASEPATTFSWEVVEAGGKLAEEKYLQEQPTLAAARDFLDASLIQMMSRYRAAIPDCPRHMIMVLGYMSAPPETLNTDPSVDYKVYLDMQFNLLANDPMFQGLYGVMCYHSAFADEEIIRWTAKLYRHYCIDGKREMLSTDPYVLPHITNPDFTEGVEGWDLFPAEAGSIDARHVPGYSYLQGRYPRTAQGDAVLWTKRSAAGPNRFSQQVGELRPGRLYSLKMFSADYQRFLLGNGVAPFEAVDATPGVAIRVDDVDLVPARSFQNSYASGRAGHALNGFDRANNLPITYHFLVFRARGARALLAVSDWAGDTDPGGPIGQELMFNFIEVQPYLED